jgi:hypothetical protein
MIEPRDILYVGTKQPLIGSKLESAEKEALVSALIRVSQKRNEWTRVRSDIIPELEQTTAFLLNPAGCKEAMCEMVNDGLVFRGKDKKGEFLDVTPKLLRLLITSTYSGGEIYPNAEELLQELPRGKDSVSDIMESFTRNTIVNHA